MPLLFHAYTYFVLLFFLLRLCLLLLLMHVLHFLGSFVMFAVSRPVICHSALCSTIGGNNACVYMLLLRLQTISATINGNKRRCVCVCMCLALHRYWNVLWLCFEKKKTFNDDDDDDDDDYDHDGDMLRSKRLKLRQWIARKKKDVKLMKKFISEEIMLSFPAPHKLDLSVRSDINESGDNEKGEIIEG